MLRGVGMESGDVAVSTRGQLQSAGLAMARRRGLFSSLLSSCLVTHLSWKLRFPAPALGKSTAVRSTPLKQSFGDKGVPKLELGHEEGGGGRRTQRAASSGASAFSRKLLSQSRA